MTTVARLKNNIAVPNHYALGVHVQTFLGHPTVWHNGAIDGFPSHLLCLSDQDIAIAVVTNAFPAPTAGDPHLNAVAIARAALRAP